MEEVSKTKSFTISIPTEVFTEMESYIDKEYTDRSEYIRRLIIADLRQNKLL